MTRVVKPTHPRTPERDLAGEKWYLDLANRHLGTCCQRKCSRGDQSAARSRFNVPPSSTAPLPGTFVCFPSCQRWVCAVRPIQDAVPRARPARSPAETCLRDMAGSEAGESLPGAPLVCVLKSPFSPSPERSSPAYLRLRVGLGCRRGS